MPLVNLRRMSFSYWLNSNRMNNFTLGQKVAYGMVPPPYDKTNCQFNIPEIPEVLTSFKVTIFTLIYKKASTWRIT
jgi:hypothetical protein